jgi:hypothetical protein
MSYRQNRRGRIASILVILAVSALAGCASITPFEPREWTEEVRLREGATITVERRVIPGATWCNDRGGCFHRVERTLRLPDGTVWNGKDWNPRLSELEPVLIDRVGTSWLLVANPSFFGDHVRLGCPVPNFLYLRQSSRGWQRIDAAEVPDNLAFNLTRWPVVQPLVLDGTAPNSPRVHLTWSQKEKLFAEWLATERSSPAESFRARSKLRYTWMSPLGYLATFSKHCDPALSACKQLDNGECDPAKLVVKP